MTEYCLVTRQTINAIEKSKYNPSLEPAFKLARLLEVKKEDIFFMMRSKNQKKNE